MALGHPPRGLSPPQAQGGASLGIPQPAAPKRGGSRAAPCTVSKYQASRDAPFVMPRFRILP
eukprot:6532138-Pyramimonas_sp.AAC.1